MSAYRNGVAVKTAAISNVTTKEAIVAAPGDNKQIVIHEYTIVADAASDATWESGNNALSGPMALTTNSVITGGGMVCNENEALNLTGDAGALNGHVLYSEVQV